MWFILASILAHSYLAPPAEIIDNLLANSSTPGSVEIYVTRNSIGIEWDITGDDDHDAICTVRFRETGSSYREGHPLYRVDFQGENMMAGSILFLEPGISYDIELTYTDPDNAIPTIHTSTVSTKIIPQMPASGQTYHVVPDDGNGPGIGSEANPFRGIDNAETVASPGDIFLLHGGDYGGTIYFRASGSTAEYLVWKAAGDRDPVFQGIRLDANHLWLEGLKIVNQQYGLRTDPPGPQNIVVKRCFFENNHYSIYLNDGGEGWYIVDNTIVGDNEPKTSNFSGEGIELWYSDGHTVAYNTISRVADGISYPGRNVDMFNNDIFDTSDDGIEFDYGYANNRAWRNRITNLFNNGISFQPMNGAPYYVLYNQVSVLNGQSVLKLRDRADRALIAHNTFIINSGPMSSGSDFLNNFEIKNNLWISIQPRYAWEGIPVVGTNWKTDWDYDGFDWNGYNYAFKWDNVRLVDLPVFRTHTGQELHSIQIHQNSCFENLNYTVEPGGAVDSFHVEYNTLLASCNAVDAGIILPSINDNYNGSNPDLGAYERGATLPHYGVRAVCNSHSTNSYIGPSPGFWYQDPSHWSLGHFPTECDHVVIPSGVQVTLNINETGLGNTLTVNPGATFITSSTANLLIQN